MGVESTIIKILMLMFTASALFDITDYMALPKEKMKQGKSIKAMNVIAKITTVCFLGQVLLVMTPEYAFLKNSTAYKTGIIITALVCAVSSIVSLAINIRASKKK